MKSATTPGAKKPSPVLDLWSDSTNRQLQHIFNQVFLHKSSLSPSCSSTKQFLPARSCSFGMVSRQLRASLNRTMARDSSQVLSCDLMALCKLYLPNAQTSFLAHETTCFVLSKFDASPAWRRTGGTTVQRMPNTDTKTSRPASSN